MKKNMIFDIFFQTLNRKDFVYKRVYSIGYPAVNPLKTNRAWEDIFETLAAVYHQQHFILSDLFINKLQKNFPPFSCFFAFYLKAVCWTIPSDPIESLFRNENLTKALFKHGIVKFDSNTQYVSPTIIENTR